MGEANRKGIQVMFSDGIYCLELNKDYVHRRGSPFMGGFDEAHGSRPTRVGAKERADCHARHVRNLRSASLCGTGMTGPAKVNERAHGTL